MAKQMDSPATMPASPSCNPSNSGVFDGLRGSDLEKRTSSPNGETELLIVKVPDSGAKMTIQ